MNDSIMVNSDEINLFYELEIVDKDNNFNPEKYQEWFKEYVKKDINNKNPTLNDVVASIEKANQISLKEKEETQIQELPINGLMKKDELISFVFEIADKKSICDTSLKIVKDIYEKNYVLDEHKEEFTKEDIINNVNEVIKPVLLNTKDPQQVEEFKEEVKVIFKNDEFTQEDIEAIFDTDSPSKPASSHTNKKTYNPYEDFAYIYYMWTLGHDYSRFLFKQNTKGKVKLFGVEDKQEKKPKKAEYVPVNKFSVQAKNQPYAAVINSFNEKYNTSLDAEEIRDKMFSLNGMDYQEYFIEKFDMAHKDGKDSIENIVEFINEFDNVFKSIANVENKLAYRKFGSLSEDDIKELLNDTLESDSNVTKDVSKMLNKRFGNPKTAKSQELINVIDLNVRTYVYNSEINQKTFNKAIRVAVANYKALKSIHDERNFTFRMLKRSDYNKETTALRDMETLLLNQRTSKDKELVRSLLLDDEIHKYGYEDQKKAIESFSLDTPVTNESIDIENTVIDIGDSKELDEIEDILSENENELNINK